MLRSLIPRSVVLLIGVLLLLTALTVWGDMYSNLGYVALMKSRLQGGMPPRAPVVYELAAGLVEGHLQHAAGHFEAALRLRPDHPLALGGLAQTRTDQREIETAIQLWQTALAAGYPDYLGQFMLGNLYAHSGDRLTAIVHWEQGVGRQADDWIRLAKLLRVQASDPPDRERWRIAVRVLEDALSTLSPPPAEALPIHLTVSDMYGWLSEREMGLEHAEIAVQLNPASAAAHAWLAWYLDQYTQASERAVAEAELSLDYGADWRAYLVLGQHDLEQCRLDQAQAAFRAGWALPTGGDYRHVYLLHGLAVTQWELGEQQAAIDNWRLVLEMQPGFQAIRNMLAEAEAGTLATRCTARPPA
jgi:tetratricopeptide (TPR) repeat protein